MAEPSGDDLLALDHQLCFSLYAASRALTGLYRELLSDLELTYPQYLVMLVLWERGTVTVKDLSRALHLDSGTLSPLLRRMESAGLLSRERTTTDERVVEVTATEAGDRLRERASGVPQAALDATEISRGQSRELRDTLDRITRSVESQAHRRVLWDPSRT